MRDALGLERVHLFGSSWGGMLAMQYVLDRGRPPVTLSMAGSPASSPRWNEICQELLDEMPAEEREEIERLEDEGKMESPEYEEAMQPFYRRHVCRLDPWPDFVVRSFDRMATPIYHYMAGPSEFRIIGTLREWDIMDRLGEIAVPTLVSGGEYDECRPVAPARGPRAHPRQPARDHPGRRRTCASPSTRRSTCRCSRVPRRPRVAQQPGLTPVRGCVHEVRRQFSCRRGCAARP